MGEREFGVIQVELMRSEISDDEFYEWVLRHPGTYHLRRPIVLNQDHGTGPPSTFIWHPPQPENIDGETASTWGASAEREETP